MFRLAYQNSRFLAIHFETQEQAVIVDVNVYAAEVEFTSQVTVLNKSL